ncbi:hypothetical protein [Halolamina sp.]|uniref:hypothetical protein n=1 Tax=Halolamina sp. TaxID=1940283 RepID=UPI003563A951
MATASSAPVQQGAIAEGAAALAFMAFLTLVLAAGAAIAGGLTVQGILGGVAIPDATMKATIAAIGCLIAAGVFAVLAALFA